MAKIRTPEQIVKRVFKRWATEVAPAWGRGIYTPSDDQFEEMAVEAIKAYLDQDGVEIAQWAADHDGVHVVQIDTPQRDGRIRINLNDAPVWDGSPSDERPGSHFHDVWDDDDDPYADYPYTLCSGQLANGEPCPFFVADNPAWSEEAWQTIAVFMHLHRGDEADEAKDDHEPLPGEVHTLGWWKKHGPDRVKERFVDG